MLPMNLLLLAQKEDDWGTIVFGVVMALIWAVGYVANLLKKKKEEKARPELPQMPPPVPRSPRPRRDETTLLEQRRQRELQQRGRPSMTPRPAPAPRPTPTRQPIPPTARPTTRPPLGRSQPDPIVLREPAPQPKHPAQTVATILAQAQQSVPPGPRDISHGPDVASLGKSIENTAPTSIAHIDHRQAARRRASSDTAKLTRTLRDLRGARTAIVLAEILAPPVALRDNPDFADFAGR